MATPMSTPVFKGLTRPASLMGLPMTYLVMLMVGVVGGFIATLSIAFLLIGTAVGYAALRALAAYDARIFDVALTVLRATPLTVSLLRGRGVTYGA